MFVKKPVAALLSVLMIFFSGVPATVFAQTPTQYGTADQQQQPVVSADQQTTQQTNTTPQKDAYSDFLNPPSVTPLVNPLTRAFTAQDYLSRDKKGSFVEVKRRDDNSLAVSLVYQYNGIVSSKTTLNTKDAALDANNHLIVKAKSSDGKLWTADLSLNEAGAVVMNKFIDERTYSWNTGYKSSSEYYFDKDQTTRTLISKTLSTDYQYTSRTDYLAGTNQATVYSYSSTSNGVTNGGAGYSYPELSKSLPPVLSVKSANFYGTGSDDVIKQIGALASAASTDFASVMKLVDGQASQQNVAVYDSATADYAKLRENDLLVKEDGAWKLLTIQKGQDWQNLYIVTGKNPDGTPVLQKFVQSQQVAVNGGDLNGLKLYLSFGQEMKDGNSATGGYGTVLAGSAARYGINAYAWTQNADRTWTMKSLFFEYKTARPDGQGNLVYATADGKYVLKLNAQGIAVIQTAPPAENPDAAFIRLVLDLQAKLKDRFKTAAADIGWNAHLPATLDQILAALKELGEPEGKIPVEFEYAKYMADSSNAAAGAQNPPASMSLALVQFIKDRGADFPSIALFDIDPSGDLSAQAAKIKNLLAGKTPEDYFAALGTALDTQTGKVKQVLQDIKNEITAIQDRLDFQRRRMDSIQAAVRVSAVNAFNIPEAEWKAAVEKGQIQIAVSLQDSTVKIHVADPAFWDRSKGTPLSDPAGAKIRWTDLKIELAADPLPMYACSSAYCPKITPTYHVSTVTAFAGAMQALIDFRPVFIQDGQEIFGRAGGVIPLRTTLSKDGAVIRKVRIEQPADSPYGTITPVKGTIENADGAMPFTFEAALQPDGRWYLNKLNETAGDVVNAFRYVAAATNCFGPGCPGPMVMLSDLSRMKGTAALSKADTFVIGTDGAITAVLHLASGKDAPIAAASWEEFARKAGELEKNDVPPGIPLEKILGGANAVLAKLFGEGRLKFETAQNSVDPAAGMLSGRIVNSEGEVVAQSLTISFKIDAENNVVVSEDSLDALKVPDDLAAGLKAQLGKEEPPVLSYYYGAVRNPQSAGPGGEVVFQDSYALRAEAEGNQVLLIEKTTSMQYGDAAGMKVEREAIRIRVVSTLPADPYKEAGVFYVLKGSVFTIHDLMRGGAGVEVARQSYAFMSDEQIGKWISGMVDKARYDIDAVVKSVQIPDVITREDLKTFAALVSWSAPDGLPARVQKRLIALRDELTANGLLQTMNFPSGPGEALQLENYASGSLAALYTKIASASIRIKAADGTETLVAVSDLSKILLSEKERVDGASYGFPDAFLKLKGLTREMVGDFHMLEGLFLMNVFQRVIVDPVPGPSLFDMQRMILAVHDAYGSIITSGGKDDPELFRLVIQGTVKALSDKITAAIIAAGGSYWTQVKILKLAVTSMNADTNGYGLSVTFAYGDKTFTADATAALSKEGVKVDVTLPPGVFEGETLKKMAGLVAGYLTPGIAVVLTNPEYDAAGMIAGAAFTFKGMNFKVRALYANGVLSGVNLFGDADGSGKIDQADLELSLLQGRLIAPDAKVFIVRTAATATGSSFAEVLIDQQPAAAALMKGEAGWTLDFVLRTDLTNDGAVTLDDVQAALKIRQEARAFAKTMANKWDLNGDAVVNALDSDLFQKGMNNAVRAESLGLLGAEEKKTMDFNGDGKLDWTDILVGQKQLDDAIKGPWVTKVTALVMEYLPEMYVPVQLTELVYDTAGHLTEAAFSYNALKFHVTVLYTANFELAGVNIFTDLNGDAKTDAADKDLALLWGRLIDPQAKVLITQPAVTPDGVTALAALVNKKPVVAVLAKGEAGLTLDFILTADVNGDGRLSPEDGQAALKIRQEARSFEKAMAAKWDLNGDGAVTQADADLFQKGMSNAIRADGLALLGADEKKILDLNGDGRLDWTDIAVGQKQLDDAIKGPWVTKVTALVMEYVPAYPPVVLGELVYDAAGRLAQASFNYDGLKYQVKVLYSSASDLLSVNIFTDLNGDAKIDAADNELALLWGRLIDPQAKVLISQSSQTATGTVIAAAWVNKKPVVAVLARGEAGLALDFILASDVNGDGKLAVEDGQAALKIRQEARTFANTMAHKWDLNGDGLVSQADADLFQNGMNNALRADALALLGADEKKLIDLNGDGKLDWSDLLAGQKQLDAVKKAVDFAVLLERDPNGGIKADLNRDGVIDDTDVAFAQSGFANLLEMANYLPQKTRALADLNADGQLSSADLDVLIKLIKARM